MGNFMTVKTKYAIRSRTNGLFHPRPGLQPSKYVDEAKLYESREAAESTSGPGNDDGHLCVVPVRVTIELAACDHLWQTIGHEGDGTAIVWCAECGSKQQPTTTGA